VLRTAIAEIPPGAVDELKLDGGEIWASVDAAVTVYPP
jgi:hypothetical protein